MPVQPHMRGAIPTPKSELAAATPFKPLVGAPPNFITVPAQLSMWGNDVNGDCVTAEEAFAKACNNPEIFISDNEVISWAQAHNALNGATLIDILKFMQNDGFQQGGHTYDDGPYSTVDFTNSASLQSAISIGPVKIGIAANQLDTTWQNAGGKSGWFAVGYHSDSNEDHCVSLCGYGTISWLAQQLNVSVPGGIDGTQQGYALFTWDTIGIIDVPSLLAITSEAWLRQPTTVTIGGAARLLHTIRGNNGSWQAQGMQAIPGQVYPAFTAINFTATAASSADGQSLQVVGVGWPGIIFHTIRDSNGNWQQAMEPIPGQPAAITILVAVGCAGSVAGLQVVGVGANGQLYHTIRANNGSWQAQGMQAIPGQPVKFSAAAAGSADGQSLQVVGVGSDGRIYHTIRDSNGNWQTGGMLAIPGQPGGSTFNAVGCGGTASGLQVVGVASNGQIYHTIRANNGNWQATGMLAIPGQPVKFSAAAAGSADGQTLQVDGVGSDGQIYYTIRDNNGNWQTQGMVAIPGQPGSYTFHAVGCGGTAAGLQVVGV